MAHPEIRQGEQELEKLRGLIQDERSRFDNESADIIAKLETFRQALVAAIGEISPAEAMAGLEKHATRLFTEQRTNVRPGEHAENVRRELERRGGQ